MIGTVSAVFTMVLTRNMFQNLRDRNLISRAAPDLVGEIEDLTLGIPVRNEEENLRYLLPQLVDQRLRPKKIVFLNDQSVDGTRKLIESYQDKFDWIECIEGEDPPLAWRGKVWALEQIIRNVKTPLVAFMDADVQLNSSLALASIWTQARSRKSAYQSIFPRPNVDRRAALLVNQVYTHLYYFLPSKRSVAFNHPKAVAGCGQFQIIPVETFKQLGGYARIRGSTHDGLQVARLFKSAGLSVVNYDGGSMVSVKMYRGLREAFGGFARNSYEADGSFIVAAVMSGVFFWIFVLPFFLLPVLWLHPAWFLAFIFMLIGQWKISQEHNFGYAHMALTPLMASLSSGVHAWGAVRHKMNWGTTWRGRIVS